MDTGKTYTLQDPEWETIKKQSISLTGSTVLTDGRATWTVRSLASARISFEIETRVQSEGTIYIQSQKITLVPESHFPTFTVISSDGSLTPKTVNADDEKGINVLFTSEDVPTTVDVEITDYVTDTSVLKLDSVPVHNKNLRLGSPTADIVLHKAGKYILKMTANGLSETTDLFIVPGTPKNLVTDIPSVILVGENRNIDLSITDTWGNVISPASWDATIHSSQPVIFSGSSEPVQDIAFSLSKKIQFRTPQEDSLTFTLEAKHNQETVTKSLSFVALSDVIVEPMITQSGAIRVGQELPVDFVMKTKSGAIIENWNRPLQIKTKGTRAVLSNDVVSFTG